MISTTWKIADWWTIATILFRLVDALNPKKKDISQKWVHHPSNIGVSRWKKHLKPPPSRLLVPGSFFLFSNGVSFNSSGMQVDMCYIIWYLLIQVGKLKSLQWFIFRWFSYQSLMVSAFRSTQHPQQGWTGQFAINFRVEWMLQPWLLVIFCDVTYIIYGCDSRIRGI